MYQPITIVKVRQQTKVTVPAGGWVLIGSPDQPLADQIARRSELIKDGHVNDDFEQLMIGRITDTHPVVRFATKEQFAALEKQRAENEKALAGSHDDAKARQKKMETDKAKYLADEHKAKVAALNKDHDRLRNLNTAPAAESTVKLETDTEPAAPAANEFTQAELAAKNHAELLALTHELAAAGRIEIPAKTGKGALIEAILAATPIVTANV